MVKIKNAKIWKSGNGFVFSLPKALVDTEVVKLDRRYDFELSESARSAKGKLNKAVSVSGQDDAHIDYASQDMQSFFAKAF